MKAVTFYGGEPLLRFDLIRQVIEYVKHLGGQCLYSFTTNGVLLGDPEILEYLAANNVVMLVSLDGPAEVHDRCRVFAQGKPSHGLVMENLERIHRLYPEYYANSISCIATLAYQSDFLKAADFFTKDHGFPLRIGRISTIDALDTDFYEVYGKDRSDEAEEAKNILFEKFRALLLKQTNSIDSESDREAVMLHKLFDEDFIAIHQRCMQSHQELHMNGCCVPGQRRVFIETDGTMHVCEKISTRYPLGSVHTGGLDLNKVKNFIEDYIRVSFEDCSECPIQKICRLCFRHAMQDGIMTAERKRELCKDQINSTINSLYHYISLKAANDNAFDFIDRMEIR